MKSSRAKKKAAKTEPTLSAACAAIGTSPGPRWTDEERRLNYRRMCAVGVIGPWAQYAESVDYVRRLGGGR